VDEKRQQGGTHHYASGPRSNCSQNAVDDGVQHPGVRHDAEEQDREYEHADDGGKAFEPVENKLAGVVAKASDQRGDDRNKDKRDKRRHPLGNDDRQQDDNCRQA
jgi:hypothetical protein